MPSLTTSLFATLTSLISLSSCNPLPQQGYGAALTSSELQARQPLGGLPSNSQYTLAYSTLGVGHQNYTCSNGVFVQTEQGDGASALLYDTTSFLETHPREIKRLAHNCNFERCKFPEIFQNLLGDHYFSELVQPTFNLTRAQPMDLVMSGVKTAAEPSNSTANVAWLYLTPNPDNNITQGLAAVYRVNTFRGVAPTSCSTQGQATSIPYTAQYWFYTQ